MDVPSDLNSVLFEIEITSLSKLYIIFQFLKFSVSLITSASNKMNKKIENDLYVRSKMVSKRPVFY